MNSNKTKKWIKEVVGDKGYVIDKLDQRDLIVFRKVVHSQYESVMSKFCRDHSEEINVPLSKYHEIHHLVDHANVWRKKNRIIPREGLQKILETKFFENIKKDLGYLFITDEDGSGFPEIYFRLVRPDPHKDVGSIHADRWFWDLNDNQVKDNYHRIKIWFSLWNKNNISGFKYVSGSHRKEYNYMSKEVNSYFKPIFDEKKYDLTTTKLKCEPGGFILFNDSLLHGGFVTKEDTRVSIECTLLIKEKDL